MTSVSNRALIAGGSLGGLFAANLLLRSGWDVRVLPGKERGVVATLSLAPM